MTTRALRRGMAAAVTAALVVSACTDAGTGTTPRARLSSQEVTGAAAAALGPAGQFVFRHHAATGLPEISDAYATKLAVTYIAEYGSFLKSHFEQEHGGAIDLGALAPCGRTLYAATRYGSSLSQSSVPLQRYLGPHWLVTLCTPTGEPTLSVAVAALAVDVEVQPGLHHLPHTGPNTFLAAGIPRRLSDLPLSPELAVQMATRATGRRVSEVPELVMPEAPFAPQLAQWTLTLEQPVAVRGELSGTRTATTAVYAGFDHGWNRTGVFIAAPNPGVARQFMDGGIRGVRRSIPLVSDRADIPAATERFSLEGSAR